MTGGHRIASGYGRVLEHKGCGDGLSYRLCLGCGVRCRGTRGGGGMKSLSSMYDSLSSL